MIDRDTLRMVLDQYLSGRVTREEISDWAYNMINEQGETSDQLVNEVLFNLVSFHDVGMIFEQYRPSREKLEYFINWLEDDGECGWDQYTAMFDPGKLM
ncbi:hypothetical protein [Phosphitispora fastidiosa]|uniref:hypothetical protein n=1 Tax=Phosphitispora fastidiosa TaxID=2837202 RepID=UPI001E339D1A|nr:hypothetical protein [Phosphitispora fastidiosa]